MTIITIFKPENMKKLFDFSISHCLGIRIIHFPTTNMRGRVATIPEKVTPTLTPAKSGSELTPVTPTPPKSRNLPYIIEPNPESDSDSFWEKSRLQATPTPGIVATPIPASLGLARFSNFRELSIHDSFWNLKKES